MTTLAQTATLAWGYTMADVDDIAWYVTRRLASGMLDFDEASAVAWFGVVEALYDADEAPPRYDLVGAGLRALSRELSARRSFHGLDTHASREGRASNSIAPGFVKYWGARHDGEDGFTERIAERLALPVVLAELTPKRYQAISTLAAFDGDMHATAAALGTTHGALEKLIGNTRRQIEALWFEHETPRSKKSTADKCSNGHSRAEHSKRLANGQWQCQACRKSGNRRAGRAYRARQEDAALKGALELEAEPEALAESDGPTAPAA